MRIGQNPAKFDRPVAQPAAHHRGGALLHPLPERLLRRKPGCAQSLPGEPVGERRPALRPAGFR